MSFDTNVPNASQSPGVFPSANSTNFTRLKAIIDADHNFLDSAADAQGAHNQVTYINRSDPSSLLTGTDSIEYGKTATDGVNELWFYDGTTPRQVNWRELSGTTAAISSTSSYTSVVAVPDNSFGDIYMWSNTGTVRLMVRGNFVVSSSVCYAWAMPTSNSSSGSTNSFWLKFANNSGTSGLNIMARRSDASSLVWNYRVFARLI
jgi:hypothetical protein